MKIVKIILILVLTNGLSITFTNARDVKKRRKNNENSDFQSQSTSRSYSYSNLNGKEQESFGGLDTDEDKKIVNGQVIKHDKYGKLIGKKNDDPLNILEQTSKLGVNSSPINTSLTGDKADNYLDNDDFFHAVRNGNSLKQPIMPELNIPSFPKLKTVEEMQKDHENFFKNNLKSFKKRVKSHNWQ